MQYILDIISCCGKILLFMKELLFCHRFDYRFCYVQNKES